MATATSKATLKTCRKANQSWLGSYAFASVGNSYEYDNISRIGYIGFTFDLTNKHITSIKLKCHCIDAGLGAWATKKIEFYGYNPSGGTYPQDQIGDYLGIHIGGNFYYCSNTLTFNADSNPELFNAMAAYFAAGNNVLLIRCPNGSELDVKTHSYGDYSDNFLKMDSCEATIEYVDTALISFASGYGFGSIDPIRVPIGISVSLPDWTPAPPQNDHIYFGTATYNAGPGATVDFTEQDLYEIYEYGFAYWCDGEYGIGSLNLSPGDSITVEGDITLYAIFETTNRYVEESITPQASRPPITVSRTVTFDPACTEVAPCEEATTSTARYYFLAGWRDTTHGLYLGEGEQFEPLGNHTFEAVWQEFDEDYPPIELPVLDRYGYYFVGWLNDAGVMVGSAYDWYVPQSSQSTLTASWIPRQHMLSIIDDETGDILYQEIVDYDSAFNIPSFATRSKDMELADKRCTFEFYDDATGFATADTYNSHVTCHFNNVFIHTEYDYDTGDFLEFGQVVSDDEIIIKNDTELICHYSYLLGTEYIKFVAPANPSTRFGYHFQYWMCEADYSLHDIGNIVPGQEVLVTDIGSGGNFIFQGVWVPAPEASGKNLYFKVNGTMKKAKKTFVKVQGQYKEAIAIFVKVDGFWKTKAD
jgi:hypothetical protein